MEKETGGSNVGGFLWLGGRNLRTEIGSLIATGHTDLVEQILPEQLPEAERERIMRVVRDRSAEMAVLLGDTANAEQSEE